MPRPTPLAGQTAVITGAASGIGRALAVRLSSHGCPVALLDADDDGLQETATLLSGPAFVRTADVRDRHGLMAFAAEVKEWAPARIGAVFNNAGVAVGAAVADAAVEDDEWLHAINYEGVVHGTRAFLPILVAQDSGAIVNTSSVFGLAGMPFNSAYCGSKFGVRGFTDSLRHELHGTGVRAINIHPGGIKTNIVRNGRMHGDPSGLQLTQEQMAEEFQRIALTTPERAAATIHKGVDAGKGRILVGPDAYLFDYLTRLTPTHYWHIMNVFQQAGLYLRKRQMALR